MTSLLVKNPKLKDSKGLLRPGGEVRVAKIEKGVRISISLNANLQYIWLAAIFPSK